MKLEYTSCFPDEDEQVSNDSWVLSCGSKSCVLATTKNSSVVKISPLGYIEDEIKVYETLDNKCKYLRVMLREGYVSGTNLRFVELEGLGVPFKKKHVSTGVQVQECWRAASQAVEALHKQEFFHRDIKPDNLLISDEGKHSQRLVLHDFDTAVSWTCQSINERAGTNMFMSPFWEDGQDYRCRDDWISLGLSSASLLLTEFPVDLEIIRDDRKLSLLEELITNHELVPEDMKTRINKALSDEHVCCERYVLYRDRFTTQLATRSIMLKASTFRDKMKYVPELLGTEKLDALVTLKWLWLHHQKILQLSFPLNP